MVTWFVVFPAGATSAQGNQLFRLNELSSRLYHHTKTTRKFVLGVAFLKWKRSKEGNKK
eukprot:m.33796 g.33796  ORF g.33796 m.33796 type:complete len:59 (-) comp16872_c0_seq1:60-236(-)